MSGAVLRSETGSLVRSSSGAFVRGRTAAAPGSVLIACRDDGVIVIDPETQQWGRLAASSGVRPNKLVWAGGVLYGASDQFVYEYRPQQDSWTNISSPEIPNIIIAHDDQLHVCGAWSVYRYTGSAWQFVVDYDPAGMVHPNVGSEETLACDTQVPIPSCAAASDDLNGRGTGILGAVSAGGRLYIGGDYWDDWTTPVNAELSCHPIIDDAGNVIAIFSAPVGALYAFDDSRFYAFVSPDATGTVRWRDTYPGCCFRVGGPSHFGMVAASAASNMMFVTAVTSFNAANVSQAFGTQTNAPTVLDFDHAGGSPLASLRYDPESLLVISPGHGLGAGDNIEIENTERYTLTPTNQASQVIAVVSADAFTVNKQFRGNETGSWVGVLGTPGSGTITAFGNGSAVPVSGIYAWTGSDWTPAFSDRSHPEGLPGAYPARTTVAHGYVGPLLLASTGARYFATDGQADSLEVTRPGLEFSRRLCFPQLDLPTADRNNTVDALIQLPAGSTLGTADQSCPGDTVASRSVFGDTQSTFTFDDATQIPEFSSIDILTSTDLGYIGTWQAQRRFSGEHMRINVPFTGTASGTWQRTGNPAVNGTFAAVKQGTTYIIQIDIGTDPRPGDLILTGGSSGAVIDLAGMGYDGSPEYLTGTGGVPVYGFRQVRSDRFGLPQTHYSLFVRLEYGDPVDPGWQTGEEISLSVS